MTDAESRLVLLGRAVTGKDSNLVSQLQSPIPSQWARIFISWLTTAIPENQEETLFLARAESGPGTFKEIDVRRIARDGLGK